MKRNNLLSYICCPSCKNNLNFQKKFFLCAHCGHKYNVIRNIPILVDLKHLPEHLKQQVKYFEYEDHSRPTASLEPWQKQFVERFLEIGKPKNGGLLIDNATGSGYMAIEFARKGYSIIATDLTLVELISLQEVLKKEKLDDRVLLICCSSDSMPIKSSCADGLVANAILEHLPKEKEAIADIYRILKKSAPVMVVMPLAYRYLFPLFWVLNYIHDKNIGHLRRYTREDIKKKFSKFSEIQTYYTGFIPKVVFAIFFIFTKISIFQYLGEYTDSFFRHWPYGASNIVSILKKR